MDYHRDLLPPSLPVNGAGDPRAQSTLNRGDNLYSATRAFRLTMQNDGNLVLYTLKDSALPFGGDVNVNDPSFAKWSTVPVWQSRTSNSDATQCRMQDDGSLALYNDGGVMKWSSRTTGEEVVATAFLRCQDDGNVVIYTVDGIPIWQTHTSAVR